jgi:NADH-quinone oxidoreductase subunit C
MNDVNDEAQVEETEEEEIELPAVVQRLKDTFPDAVTDFATFKDEITVVIRREDLLDVGRFLMQESEFGFDFLTLLTAVDYYPNEPRFEMVYHLYSMTHGSRLVLKARLSEDDPTVESVTPLWPSADWHEREAYDLMGIQFQNHPDLRRMFMPDDWEGHPLRKDYPLKGPDRHA